MTTTITYASFLVAFPEFGNTTQFPQSQVEFWLGESVNWIGQRGVVVTPTPFIVTYDGASVGGRWQIGQLPLVTMLYAAHNLALGAINRAAGATGGVPGEARGPVTSKSVDKVSVGFSTGTTIEGAGPWNATSYGQRLYQIMRGVNTFMVVPGPRTGRYGYGYGVRGYRGFR